MALLSGRGDAFLPGILDPVCPLMPVRNIDQPCPHGDRLGAESARKWRIIKTYLINGGGRGIHLQGVKEMETEETLSKVWDQHVGAEFAAHNADQAVATMTAEAYINEIPLMIGARGRNEVRNFYAN